MKYFLCIPDGGFNDTFCQIERAYKYSMRHKRRLIINTEHCGLHDRLDNYFCTDNPAIALHPSEELLSELNQLDVFPAFNVSLKEYLQNCSVLPRMESLNKFGGTTPDLKKDYRERLVVFHNGGGGKNSFRPFANLMLKKQLAENITAQLSERSVCGDYDAIHVRNTDYTTDFKSFFNTLRETVKNRKLLICSDDWDCREYAKSFFDQSEVVTAADIKNTGGVPLHTLTTDVYANNRSMLADLVALSGAKRLFFTSATPDGEPSGFSTLADSLRQHRDIRRFMLTGTKGPLYGIKYRLLGYR